MATIWGNSVNGTWQGWGEYSTSQTATQFTINLSTGMRSLNYGFAINYIYASANINGNDAWDDNLSFYSGYGQTVDKYFVDNSVTYDRLTYAQTKTITAYVKNHSGFQDGVSSASTTITIPALDSYSVKYDANGGTGAPGTQTKWYGQTLKLSSTKPTRTGYSFQGWAKSASGAVAYAAGANYTSNAAITLYAVWKANTYTVKYDANGGTGAPAAQTKTYGVTLKLSPTKPTRKNYNFLGWGTSAGSTTVSYAAGANYTGNKAITLYAVWELAYVAPTITEVSADRCNSAGVLSEEGTYALVKFNWKLDTIQNPSLKSISIGYKQSTASTYAYDVVWDGSGDPPGAFIRKVVGAGTLNTDYIYDIRITVTDTIGSNYVNRQIADMEYIIDFRKGGKGIAIGKPATADGFEVAMPTVFENPVTFEANSKFNSVNFLTNLSKTDGVSRNALSYIGSDIIASTSEDTVNKWMTFGCGYAWFSKTGRVTGQPSQYGFLHNMTTRGTVVTQLWYSHLSSGVEIYQRSGNTTSGWFSTWQRKLKENDIIYSKTTNKDSWNQTWTWYYLKQPKSKQCIIQGHADVSTAIGKGYYSQYYNENEQCVYPFKLKSWDTIQTTSVNIGGGLIGIRPLTSTSTGTKFYIWNPGSDTYTHRIDISIFGVYA